MFFLVPRPSNFEAKLTKKRPQANQKSSKKLVSILIQFSMDLGTRLGRFWEGFGGQAGSKLGPNATKTRPQNKSKKLTLLGKPPERFGVGGPGGVLIFTFWKFFGSWGHLSAKTAPRRPNC